MFRSLLLLSGLLLVLSLPVISQTIGPAYTQPPLVGIVTFMEPHGQFYMNIGDVDQLYRCASVLIVREGEVIGKAQVIRVNRLDSIGQLLPEYQGLRLEAGDYTVITDNPIPATPPTDWPYMEPDDSQQAGEFLVILAAIYAIGSGFAH